MSDLPVIKSSLGYTQRQVAGLSVAKDLGDSVVFLASTLCVVLAESPSRRRG
jgi:hypothetical protein